MELNRYVIKNKDINTLLDEIDTIVTDMCTFSKLHNGYSCNVDINKSTSHKNLFNAEIELRYEKQKDKTGLLGIVEPPTLL